MNQIEVQHEYSTHKKSDLERDISDLEMNLLAAQENVKKLNEGQESYNQVSPEQANELKRVLIFLKRDLLKKQAELELLGLN